eukprot:201964-Rhodomonas_salina.3
MMVGSVAWAVLPSQQQRGGGGLGRGAGQVHLVLFLAGVLLKVLDDSKLLCVGLSSLRRSLPLSSLTSDNRRCPRAWHRPHPCAHC